MPYKACLQCELLFEVEAAAMAAPMACPTCGQPLSVYTPDEDELDFLEDVPTGSVQPFGAEEPTQALDATLIAQAEAMALQGDPGGPAGDPTGPIPAAAPIAVAPTPVPVPAKPRKNPFKRGPLQMPGAPEPVAPADPDAPRQTRVLDVVDGLDAAELEPPTQPVRPASRAKAPQPVAPQPAAPQPVASQPVASQPVAPNLADSGPRGTARLEGVTDDDLGSLGSLGAPTAPIDVSQRPAAQAPAEPVLAGPEPVPEIPFGPPPATGRKGRGARKVSSPGKSRRGLILGLGALVVLGGGGAGLWFALSDGDETPQASSSDAAVAASAPEAAPSSLADALAQGGVTLPEVPAARPLTTWPYVMAGPEVLATSAGPVAGMPSLAAAERLVESDTGGEWVGPLVPRLANADKAPGVMLALDLSAEARAVVRFAEATRRAGFPGAALVVKAGGGLSMLPFVLFSEARRAELGPSLVVYLGRTRVNVNVEGADGATVARGQRSLARGAEDGLPEAGALEALISELKGKHPEANSVVLRALGDMEAGALALMMARIQGPQGRRFGQLALAVQ